jgi:stage II sporulation protein R
MGKTMKNLLRNHALTISMLVGTAAAVAIASFTAFAADSERITDEVLRLHIIAESNTDDDQAFKYVLRDYILQNFTLEFADAETLETARLRGVELLPEIEQAAQEFAYDNGVNSRITAEITEMFFTTRSYGDYTGSFTLPAGTYSALRIVIGDGNGDNWWCVMFPMLCLPAVTEIGSQPSSTVTIPETIDERPQVKFAIFEMFARWFQ